MRASTPADLRPHLHQREPGREAPRAFTALTTRSDLRSAFVANIARRGVLSALRLREEDEKVATLDIWRQRRAEAHCEKITGDLCSRWISTAAGTGCIPLVGILPTIRLTPPDPHVLQSISAKKRRISLQSDQCAPLAVTSPQ